MQNKHHKLNGAGYKNLRTRRRQKFNDTISQNIRNHKHGDLLPKDKVNKVKKLKIKIKPLCFVGDGVNDAPVVALSDEDYYGRIRKRYHRNSRSRYQNDEPSKNCSGNNMMHKPNASLGNTNPSLCSKSHRFNVRRRRFSHVGSSFADVGVALLAILNAVRIQRMKF